MKIPKKCLIVGGAGFIGSHLIDALLSKGYRVICVDNLITGSLNNIAHHKNDPGFLFFKHDIVKPFPKNIRSKLSDTEYIYHLASPASPPKYRKYSIETLLVNSIGTLNLLELARVLNSIFLFTSTSEVYGDPLEHPQKETYFGNVNPIGPRACYDEGKRYAEALAMEFFRKYNLDIRIVRIFNTYGPRMQLDDGRVISNFISQAIARENLTVYGDGFQTRSFCYVSDMVKGIIIAAEKQNIKGEIFNLGYPKEHTINEIARIILNLAKVDLDTCHLDKLEDDPNRRKPDITKAQKILNWYPKVDLITGLKETIKYYQKIQKI